MEGTDSGAELQGRMQRVDEVTLSPEQRATRLWNLIGPTLKELDDDIPDYDLLCLCIEITAMLSNGSYPWALEAAKKLSKDLYLFHYYVFGEQELNNAKGDPTPLSTDPDTADDGIVNRRKGDIQSVEGNREGEDTRHEQDGQASDEHAEHSIRSSDKTTGGQITGKLKQLCTLCKGTREVAYKLSQGSIDAVKNHLDVLVKAYMIKANEVVFPIKFDDALQLTAGDFEEQYQKVAEAFRYELYQGMAAAAELNQYHYASLRELFEIQIQPAGLVAKRKVIKAATLEEGEISTPESFLTIDDYATTAFHVLGVLSIKDPHGSASIIEFTNTDLQLSELNALRKLCGPKHINVEQVDDKVILTKAEPEQVNAKD